MNKVTNISSQVLASHSPAEQSSQLRAGLRGPRLQALVSEVLPQREVAAPPDDTLTEMEGLARNPNATGAYAGSF